MCIRDRKDAAARSEAMLQEAKAQAAGIKAKAEADILQEKKKAVNEIKNCLLYTSYSGPYDRRAGSTGLRAHLV